MNFQTIVVFAIIAVAVLFVGSKLIGKRKTFSTKGDCDDDCGCGKK